MFDDPQSELKRLEQQLLKEEGSWLDRELEEAHQLLGDKDYYREPERDLENTQVFRRDQMPVRNYANNYGRGVNYHHSMIYDFEEEYRDQQEPEKKPSGNRGLKILALVETAAILAIIGYWLVKLL